MEHQRQTRGACPLASFYRRKQVPEIGTSVSQSIDYRFDSELRFLLKEPQKRRKSTGKKKRKNTLAYLNELATLLLVLGGTAALRRPLGPEEPHFFAAVA
jgi:hypothetical protein